MVSNCRICHGKGTVHLRRMWMSKNHLTGETVYAVVGRCSRCGAIFRRS